MNLFYNRVGVFECKLCVRAHVCLYVCEHTHVCIMWMGYISNSVESKELYSTYLLPYSTNYFSEDI